MKTVLTAMSYFWALVSIACILKRRYAAASWCIGMAIWLGMP